MDKVLKVVAWLSGEWLLRERANGGGVIFLRALLVTALIFTFAMVLKAVVDPERTWDPSLREAQIDLRDNIDWIGAIFIAVYTGLYARYASQWSYLAGLYNQIMAAASTTSVASEKNEPLDYWKAGFIEDCYYLHLDRKKMFSEIINHMLSQQNVRCVFIDTVSKDVVQEICARHSGWVVSTCKCNTRCKCNT
ncbi:hypothetical protein IXO884_10835 [Xanthomonas oryzae pv. oryzae]|uniref:hypothetical protein n=1 Tax=Xanthomonas oryzae TaxID=347 RepID=UPI000949E749|nr:hypothetical protein [Xanthomonas oryzae]OLK93303.1 hypothetical protein IXO884_10835 [Xanthomonas oryzae pv. oryzae]